MEERYNLKKKKNNLTSPSPHLGPAFLKHFVKFFGMARQCPNKFEAQKTATWLTHSMILCKGYVTYWMHSGCLQDSVKDFFWKDKLN